MPRFFLALFTVRVCTLGVSKRKEGKIGGQKQENATLCMNVHVITVVSSYNSQPLKEKKRGRLRKKGHFFSCEKGTAIKIEQSLIAHIQKDKKNG